MNLNIPAIETPNAIAFRLQSILLFTTGYVFLALVGELLALNAGREATMFLASGLYFAVLLSSEPRNWLRWVAVMFVVEVAVCVMLYQEDMPEALAEGLGHMAGVLSAAHAVRIACGLPFHMHTMQQVLALSIAAGVVSPLIGVAWSALYMAITGQAVLGDSLIIYWAGNAAGALVVAPLILALRQFSPSWRSAPPTIARAFEAVALAATLVGILHFVFTNSMPTAYLALPCMLWAAVRFGMPGTTLAMAVFTVIAVRYTASGQGPYVFALSGGIDRALVVHSFLALSCISALCLTVVIYQYQTAQRALKRARDELDQRVLERTAALARSERLLRESNAQFAVARAAARIIVLDWDIATDTLTFSDDPVWLRGPLPPGGKYPTYKDQVHAEDRERFLQMRQSALDTLQGHTMDYRIVRTDGIVLWVQSHLTIFAGQDGKAKRLVSATQDISARKQIEASMRESEQRLRALLDGIPDRAWLRDAAGRYIAVNRAHELGYGRSASKIIGKTIFEVNPAVADRVMSEDRQVMAGRKSMQFVWRAPAGGVWAEVTKTPIFGADGSVAGLVGVWRDITVRKEAEQQALMDSEQRYRTLVNVTSQAIWILDAEGGLKSIIKSITGDRLDHVKTRDWLEFIHEEDRASAEAAMQTAIATKSSYEHEHRLRDQDGRSWDVLARAVPVLNADGSVREWIGTSMDVSGRKTAERALLKVNRSLRNFSGRRESVREAERGRIAQNLHDGAGQSLNVVRMKLAALAKAMEAAPAQGAQAAQLAEVQNIVDQVNQEVRSLEFELSPPVLRQLGLVPALGWLAEEMQRSYGLSVSVSDDDEDKPLDQALRASTFRAVRELLINVAKHAKVNTAHVDSQRSGRSVLITVSDMGAGFDTTSIDVIETGGLGLAGVRERIEFAGGSVRFISAPGAGTAVTITLPLKEGTP